MFPASKYMQQQVMRLTWPVILEMSGLMAVGVAVTAMVGNFGAVSVAAVGLATLLQHCVAMIFAAAGTGAAIIVAHETGAGRWERIRLIAGQAIMLGLSIGLLISAAGCLAVGHIFDFIPANRDVAALASELLSLMFIFIAPYLIMSIGNAILRGMGLTRVALAISTCSNIISLTGSYGLIYGKGLPADGAAGAVWATGVAQFAGGLLVLVVLSCQPKVKLRLADIFSWHMPIIQQILGVSIPAALEQLALQGGRIVFTLLLAGVGAVQFAAHQIALQIESISFLPGFAFSVAAMTLVGQSLGRKLPHRAARYVRITRSIALWSMAGMGAIFIIFARQLTAFFINDPETIHWGSLCVMIAALEQPTIALTFVLGGALRGACDTKWPMYVAAAGVWLVRMPLIYLLITVWRFDITAAWYVTAGDYLLRSGILWWRFESKKCHIFINKEIYNSSTNLRG